MGGTSKDADTVMVAFHGEVVLKRVRSVTSLAIKS